MMRMRFLVAAVLLLATAGAFAADQKQMSVTIKQTQVRDKPGYLGKILGALSYGDRVTVLDQPAGAPKDWLRVAGPDNTLQGWVNASALTSKRIVLKSGSENVEQGASSGEVALAGKGFNETIEKEYKQGSNLDYTWVDRMEQYTVTPEQVAAFIKQGGLAAEGGGQ